MENINTTCYVMEYGVNALEDYLRSLDLESLKILFRSNRIDRVTNLRKKSLAREELIIKIVDVSNLRAHRGDAFRDQ